jgi:hypothetical protein
MIFVVPSAILLTIVASELFFLSRNFKPILTYYHTVTWIINGSNSLLAAFEMQTIGNAEAVTILAYTSSLVLNIVATLSIAYLAW